MSTYTANTIERNKIGDCLKEIDSFETKVDRIKNELMKYNNIEVQK